MLSYQYRKSHYRDKTILRPSYLHNGISYTGKMTSLYLIRAQVLWHHTSPIWLSREWNCQTTNTLIGATYINRWHNTFTLGLAINIQYKTRGIIYMITGLSNRTVRRVWSKLRVSYNDAFCSMHILGDYWLSSVTWSSSYSTKCEHIFVL